VLERFASAAPFIAGDAFSIADIAAATIVYSVAGELPWDRLPAFSRSTSDVDPSPRRAGAREHSLSSRMLRGIQTHAELGGSHNSTLFPSGSITQANFPNSDSSIFSSTWQPSSFKALTKACRSSTR